MAYGYSLEPPTNEAGESGMFIQTRRNKSIAYQPRYILAYKSRQQTQWACSHLVSTH